MLPNITGDPKEKVGEKACREQQELCFWKLSQVVLSWKDIPEANALVKLISCLNAKDELQDILLVFKNTSNDPGTTIIFVLLEKLLSFC